MDNLSETQKIMLDWSMDKLQKELLTTQSQIDACDQELKHEDAWSNTGAIMGHLASFRKQIKQVLTIKQTL